MVQSATSAGPAFVYLDQNFWIGLSQARLGQPTRAHFNDAWDLLTRGVAGGSLIVPLSSTHYYEVGKIRDARRRHDLATTMAQLSRYPTMADLRSLRRAEFQAALASDLGLQAPAAFHLISYGMYFAHGRGRAPGHGGSELEFKLLAGPTAEEERLWRQSGYRPEEVRTVAEKRAQQEATLAASLTPDKRRQRLGDIVTVSDLVPEFGNTLDGVLAEYGLTWDDFFDRGADWINKFLAKAPSVHVWLVLKTANHRNADKPWKSQDVQDIDALSRAVPYCDVVATERHSCALIRAAGLDRQYRTRIVPDGPGLIAALSDAVQAA
jgi:hypothetical protein